MRTNEYADNYRENPPRDPQLAQCDCSHWANAHCPHCGHCNECDCGGFLGG